MTIFSHKKKILQTLDIYNTRQSVKGCKKRKRCTRKKKRRPRRKRTRRNKIKKKRRKTKRRAHRMKKQRGGIRFKISDDTIENWRNPHKHNKDCFPCALSALGLNNECVYELIDTTRNIGMGKGTDRVIDFFNKKFPDAKINKYNTDPNLITKETPENWKKLFKNIEPGTAAIAQLARDKKLGHAILLAKTSNGRPILIDPQIGEIFISEDGQESQDSPIYTYLMARKAIYIQILESAYGKKTIQALNKGTHHWNTCSTSNWKIKRLWKKYFGSPPKLPPKPKMTKLTTGVLEEKKAMFGRYVDEEIAEGIKKLEKEEEKDKKINEARQKARLARDERKREAKEQTSPLPKKISMAIDSTYTPLSSNS